jgi:tetratricopeptide (TPR) repeat protein
MLLLVVLLVLVGAAVEVAVERRVPSARLRKRVGVAAVAVACLAPLAAFTSVAFSERGIGDRIDELTSETQVAPQEGGGRVFAASSSRGKYWREAFRVFEDRPLEGVGAGAFEKARLRHRIDQSVTQHAHGWIPQTMADLGLIGLLVTTLLLLAWGLAALSATGLLPRRLMRANRDDAPLPRRDWNADRIALVTLLLVPVVFGVQSLLDWTWFIQAPTAIALIGAGFLAGRGPLGADERAEPRETPVRPDRFRIGGAVVAVGTALLLAWTIWQPEASDRATNEALALADERKFDEAIAKTEEAENLNPLTPDPLLVRAAVDTAANRVDEAQKSLERAVILFPGDPQTWYRLAAFELGTRDAPEQALETIRGALYLNPHSAPARNLFLDARARQREKHSSAWPQRVARANSVPDRRRSDATSKPSSSSRRRSERRVKKRRWGESGSGRRPNGRCAGVVSASVPPGRSTRRISDSSSCTSRMCSIVSAQSTRSKLLSPNGSTASGSSSTRRASGRRARARSSATAETSAAVSPFASSSLVSRPSPHPRSSARSTWPSERTKRRSGSGGGPGCSGRSSQSSSS